MVEKVATWLTILFYAENPGQPIGAGSDAVWRQYTLPDVTDNAIPDLQAILNDTVERFSVTFIAHDESHRRLIFSNTMYFDINFVLVYECPPGQDRWNWSDGAGYRLGLDTTVDSADRSKSMFSIQRLKGTPVHEQIGFEFPLGGVRGRTVRDWINVFRGTSMAYYNQPTSISTSVNTTRQHYSQTANLLHHSLPSSIMQATLGAIGYSVVSTSVMGISVSEEPVGSQVIDGKYGRAVCCHRDTRD